MRSLLLVAHGSRRAASNEEVRALTSLMAQRASGRFDRVACAFLELADPTIPEGIEEAVQAGATEIVVLPYFLAAGRHVSEDIPGEVNGKRTEHPQVRIRIAPYLGRAEELSEILFGLAAQR